MQKSENIFSVRLALAMNRHGVSQSDVARSLGISQAAVSRWLSGSMPRIAIAARLAELLNCRLEWLLDGKGDEPGQFSAFARPDTKEETRIALLPENERLAAYKKMQNAAKEKFPYRLRMLREQTGLGVNEFARHVGYGASYISRLESAARVNPSLKFLDKLTECFGVNRLWLLYGQKPVQFVPKEKWGKVIPTVDIAMLDKLEAIDERENKAAQDELSEVIGSLARMVDPQKLAAAIELLNQKNEGGRYTELATDLLKDVLVERISKGKKSSK